jgi:hypothetical protein
MNINKDDIGNDLLKQGVFVPNWFDREHFEMFLGRDLSDSEFTEICQTLWENGIADRISEEIRDWINCFILFP